MQAQYGDQVNIIGVAGRDTLADMQDFVAEYGVDGFEHIADEDVQIWRDYDITSQPAFAFIDDSGSVETIISSLGRDGLVERIEALIA